MSQPSRILEGLRRWVLELGIIVVTVVVALMLMCGGCDRDKRPAMMAEPLAVDAWSVKDDDRAPEPAEPETDSSEQLIAAPPTSTRN